MKYVLASLVAGGLMGGVLIAEVKPLSANTQWCNPAQVVCSPPLKKCTCENLCPYARCKDPSDQRRVLEDREKSSNSKDETDIKARPTPYWIGGD